jgi:hypothetical protein
MIIKMPAFKTLIKINRYTKSSLKHCLVCSQVLGRAQPAVISTVLGAHHEYFNLK